MKLKRSAELTRNLRDRRPRLKPKGRREEEDGKKIDALLYFSEL
jgi:hypothetical protein